MSETALKLCGQCAVVLGWQPGEFWDATPAELACVLTATMPEASDPLGAADIAKLMEAFPDAATGSE